MKRSVKLFSVAVGGFAGLVILIAVTAVLLLRANAKSRAEAVVSEALDMEVDVGGAAIGLFPGLHVTLADVHARERGVDVASAGEVELGIEILPLLHKEVRIKSIVLERLRITLERDRDGKLNVERSSAPRKVLPALTVARVSVSDATLTYTDRKAGDTLEGTDCDLDMSRLVRSSGGSPDLLESLSFMATAACAQIRTKEFTVSEVNFSVDANNGSFDFDPVTMRLFGGNGSGQLRMEYSGSEPIYHVRYSLAQFRIEEFFRTLSPKPVGEGALDFSATLSLRGKTVEAMKRSAEGKAFLHGRNLKLEMGDLDEKFSRYEASQSFNLVDVGAFFFVGPLGLGVTKGYDFARILEGSGGSTSIRSLVSHWNVEHGVAYATDVAMATQKNRVALRGGLDFVNGRFNDVTVALIDDRGCAKVQQRVRGPFRQPEVEKPNVLVALTGPTRKLLEEAGELFGRKCEVFYAGSVAPAK
jgi:hypothetical protein